MRILAIDGGGIRGLIPAVVLAEVERRSGRRTAELFDLIAGTSTGGILACGLTRPGGGGKPLHSAEELAGIYRTEGPKIFDRSLLKRVTSVEGLLDERYDDSGLNRALATYLGETRLRAALCDVLITAYDIEGRFAFFFRSARARTDAEYDFSMAEAARATSAAPTYFEPVQVTDAAGARTYSLVDGGVFAVNPAMCAYAEVLRHFPGAETLLLSLGTGERTRKRTFGEIEDWGLAKWARPILDVVFDGVSDAVDYQLRHTLGEGRYHRLQVELKGASDDLDDADEANLRALRGRAEELIASSEDALRTLAAELGPPAG